MWSSQGIAAWCWQKQRVSIDDDVDDDDDDDDDVPEFRMNMESIFNPYLTHYRLMLPFYTPWKLVQGIFGLKWVSLLWWVLIYRTILSLRYYWGDLKWAINEERNHWRDLSTCLISIWILYLYHKFWSFCILSESHSGLGKANDFKQACKQSCWCRDISSIENIKV